MKEPFPTRALLACLAFAMATSACNCGQNPHADAGAVVDAGSDGGQSADGGVSTDGGTAPDGGTTPDGGASDAGGADAGPPTSQITAPADGGLVGGSFALAGTCAAFGGATVSAVAIFEDATQIGMAAVTQGVGGQCAFSYAFQASGIEACISHAFSSQATDDRNDVQTPPGPGPVLFLDDVAPGMPTGLGTVPASPTSLTSLSVLTGTAPCSAYEATVTGGGLGTGSQSDQLSDAGMTCGCAGTVPFSLAAVPLSNAPGADTLNQLVVTVTDSAGNTSAPALSSVMQDSTPPSISSLTVGGVAEDDIPQPPGAAQLAFREVPAGSDIVIVFDDPICGSNGTQDCLSGDTANLSLTRQPGNVNDPLVCVGAASGNGTTVTCTPQTPIVDDAVYALALSAGITDGSFPGNHLTAGATYYLYAHQTAAPVVSSALPAFGATGVSVANHSISIVFDEAMDPDADANSVLDPANYVVEDCFLANPSNAIPGDPGCTDITSAITNIGWTAFDPSGGSYTATLDFPAGALGGYYHSYKVTVAPSGRALHDLAGAAATSSVFLYGNQNRLPSVAAGSLPADGGALAVEPSASTSAAALMFGLTDVDGNPAVVWDDCAANVINLTLWDGDAHFVTSAASGVVTMPSPIATAATSAGVNHLLLACPNQTSLTAAASTLPSAQHLFTVAWTDSTGSASSLDGRVEVVQLRQPLGPDGLVHRWEWATGNAVNALPGTANRVTTLAQVVVDPTSNVPEVAIAEVTSSAVGSGGIAENRCTNTGCTAFTGVVALGLDGNGNADGSDKATSLSATITSAATSGPGGTIPAGTLIVTYTASAHQGLWYIDDHGTPASATQLDGSGTSADDSLVSSALVVGPSSVSLVSIFGENLDDDVKALQVSLESGAAMPTLVYVDSPGATVAPPRLAAYGTSTGVGFFRVSLATDPSIYVASTTDFVTWMVAALPEGGTQFTGQAGPQVAYQGGLVFQGGPLAGTWADFYSASIAGNAALVYRQQSP